MSLFIKLPLKGVIEALIDEIQNYLFKVHKFDSDDETSDKNKYRDRDVVKYDERGRPVTSLGSRPGSPSENTSSSRRNVLSSLTRRRSASPSFLSPPSRLIRPIFPGTNQIPSLLESRASSPTSQLPSPPIGSGSNPGQTPSNPIDSNPNTSVPNDSSNNSVDPDNSYDLAHGFTMDDIISAQRQLTARLNGVGVGPNKTYSKYANVFHPTGNPETDLTIPQIRAILLSNNAVVNNTGTRAPEYCYMSVVRPHLSNVDLNLPDHFLAKRRDHTANGPFRYSTFINGPKNLTNLIGALEDQRRRLA
jgi:hypothetical protein